MSDNNYTFETVLIQVEFDLNTDDDKLTTKAVQKIPVSEPEKVHPSKLKDFCPDLEHASRKSRLNHRDEEEAYTYTAVFPRSVLDDWYDENVAEVDDVDEDNMNQVRKEFAEMCVDLYNAVSETPVDSPEALRDAEGLNIVEDDEDPTEAVQKDGDDDE